MTLLLLAPIGLPLIAAAVFAIGGWRRGTALCGIVLIVVMLTVAGRLSTIVTGQGTVSTAAGFIRVDALAAWMLLVVAAVSLLAVWASPAYLADAHASRRRARWYGVLLNLFIAAMAAAVMSANIGVLWVAIEATTIVTAFLVGHHGTRTALEAAWKYVLICSAAIAIAFLGLVLLYYAARHAGLDSAAALNWTELTRHADQLDPAITRIAVGLIVLGFGAKAGLVPLHAWLPDAHAQAPAPVSALMSGVLLSVAFTAVLRCRNISDAAVGPAYLRTLLIIIALATLAVAAILLLAQRDYKRMLAYSSMEHMGLIAFGAAVGTRLAIAAVLLHMAGHGLAKTVAFLSSGHILHRFHTSDIAGVRGLAVAAPSLAVIFGLALAGLLGFPPAAVFASELGIARAGANAGLGWAVAAAFSLALLAFAAIVGRSSSMLLGPGHPNPSDPPARAMTIAAATPLLLGLAAVAALGITTGPLTNLLHTAAAVVGVR